MMGINVILISIERWFLIVIGLSVLLPDYRFLEFALKQG